METRINGKKVDITIENEKTVGEVMAALETWLSPSGHRLSGFSIDGESVPVSSINEAFNREISRVNTLEIKTTSLAELTVYSLANIISDIGEYEKLSYEERTGFFNSWKETPQAVFTRDHLNDIYNLSESTFSKGTMDSKSLRSIIEERLRETENPEKEYGIMKPLIEDICTRLADLPLDIQTGKDSRAAQTIQIFSSLTEKLFRILSSMAAQGSAIEGFTEKLNQFSKTIDELLSAYEKNDSVLIGDMAEYEIAPRLRELYDIIGTCIK